MLAGIAATKTRMKIGQKTPQWENTFQQIADKALLLFIFIFYFFLLLFLLLLSY